MVNARSLSSINQRDTLELYIKQNKLDIVAITETWASEIIREAELNIDGYVTYRRDRHEIRKAGKRERGQNLYFKWVNFLLL